MMIASSQTALADSQAIDTDPPVVCVGGQFEQQDEPSAPLSSDEIAIEAGTGNVTLGGDAILHDGVSASSGGYKIEADEGSYNQQQGVLSLIGDIAYTGAGANITSQEAVLNYLYGSIEFADAEFQLGNGAARGAASLLRINRRGNIRLESVAYTACPPGKDDWIVRAKKIRLDTEQGVGEASGLSLRFKNVPILYTPYLSFPISAQRKTGFLLPRIGQSARNGIDISAPWYWNIAPAYDATITPRILSRRGIQLDTQLRYLSASSEGAVRIAHLPSDSMTGINRTQFQWNNKTDFASRWRAFADVTDVSDDAYLEDLGGSLSNTSATHLNRSIGVRYLGQHLRGDLRVTHYQTIDALITEDLVPYRLMPSLRLNGFWQDLPLGLQLGFDSDFSRFERDVGVVGQRYHVAPSVGLSAEHNGFFVRPKLRWLHTQYQLDEDSTNGDTSLTRSLPTATVDAGVRFERDIAGGAVRQTLEPHIFYVHIPFRDQADLPVFDTIQPINSLEQLYRSNRFIGIDRIGDTDQLTIGVTMRLINNDDGKAILTATVGQSRNLSEQAVSLPGFDASLGNSSDYVAELNLNVWGNWNIDFAQQWNSERSQTSKSEIRLQYLPGGQRVVNLGYRFRRDSVDQGDMSWSWPISSRWNVVGRYNYSFREKTTLERFVGLEYQSCCWGLSIVSRRFISRRDGTSDTAIAIQLELKGLTSVGDPVDKLLERGILGYRAN